MLAANLHASLAYSPKGGDFLEFSETITVNDGQGSYAGYTDQTQVTGAVRMNSVGGSNVSASYSYTYRFSNNQQSSTSYSKSGVFTWSSSNFTYVVGTDNQNYSKPVYVWFAMDPSIPVGGTFYALSTQFTVTSKNYSFQMPGGNQGFVQTIQASGTGQYLRNDDYGTFTASYTWTAYFDPSTGYIVGYNYVEHDNGQYLGQPGSFTYTDELYVTSTSYHLAPASAPVTSVLEAIPYADYFVASAAVLTIIATVVYIRTRRRRKGSLPEHPYAPGTPPPSPTPTPASTPTPWESTIGMGSKPTEQVVIRDVAKVNCKYCGTLIPTTVDRCPYCGGPRQ